MMIAITVVPVQQVPVHQQQVPEQQQGPSLGQTYLPPCASAGWPVSILLPFCCLSLLSPSQSPSSLSAPMQCYRDQPDQEFWKVDKACTTTTSNCTTTTTSTVWPRVLEGWWTQTRRAIFATDLRTPSCNIWITFELYFNNILIIFKLYTPSCSI